MNLRKIKRLLRALTPEQLLNLDTWLHGLISGETAISARAMGRHETVKKHKASRRTYRLESIRCGKERCKCASGEPHGPYWYAYWTESGRTKSQYIGKRLPTKNKR